MPGPTFPGASTAKRKMGCETRGQKRKKKQQKNSRAFGGVRSVSVLLRFSLSRRDVRNKLGVRKRERGALAANAARARLTTSYIVARAIFGASISPPPIVPLHSFTLFTLNGTNDRCTCLRALRRDACALNVNRTRDCHYHDFIHIFSF